MNHTSPAFLAMIAAHQKIDDEIAKYYSIAIGGLMGSFVLQYWLSIFMHHCRARDGKTAKTADAVSSRIRGVLLRKIPLFNSVGHFLLFLLYLGINVILSFWHLDHGKLDNFSRRMGWIGALNMALTTFLALKNTPLAVLTPYSYERLNILHQLSGYTTVAAICMHAITFLKKWVGSAKDEQLRETEQIYGMVAGASMVATLFAALVLRRLRYELFYVVHVSLFMVIIIMIGMHRPNITTHTLIITLFAASIWCLDRIIRFLRISYHALGTSVAISPLPHGAVRLRFSQKTSLWRARPGGHVFLWIPSVRALEMHPFTLVSTNPLELVIMSQDGFTRDLREKAIKHPGARLRASVDGPYGALPSWSMYDRVLLIAGGSGATFVLGVALAMLRLQGGRKRPQQIELIWVIKDQEYITWFENELAELSASPHIALHIHISRTPSAESTRSLTPVTILAPMNTAPTRSSPKFTHVKSQSLTSTPVVTLLSPPPVHTKSKSLTSPIVTVLTSSPIDISPLSQTSTFNNSPASASKSRFVPGRDDDSPVYEKHHQHSHSSRSSPKSSDLDLEKSLSASTTAASLQERLPDYRLDVKIGKPELGSCVRQFAGGYGAIGSTSHSFENMTTRRRNGAVGEKLMVSACGPKRMMEDVRGAVADCVSRGEGGHMELHLEQFGW